MSSKPGERSEKRGVQRCSGVYGEICFCGCFERRAVGVFAPIFSDAVSCIGGKLLCRKVNESCVVEIQFRCMKGWHVAFRGWVCYDIRTFLKGADLCLNGLFA